VSGITLPACLTRHDAAPRASLAVDENNPVALRTYLAGGWQDSGKTVVTCSGPAWILHLALR
jgi:hypothetical protein